MTDNKPKKQNSDLNDLRWGTPKTPKTSFASFEGEAARPFQGEKMNPDDDLSNALTEFNEFFASISPNEIALIHDEKLFRPSKIEYEAFRAPKGIRNWIRIWKLVLYEFRKKELEQMVEVNHEIV